MAYQFSLVSLGFIALATGICLFELRRTRNDGIDVISIFMVLFVLQCCGAAAAIFALLPHVDPLEPTGIYAFDKILRGVDLMTALLLLVLTVGFVIFFYAGCALGRFILPQSRSQPGIRSVYLMHVRGWAMCTVLGLGLMLTLYSFYLLGDTILVRYAQLVLFRSQDTDIARNAFNANAFALTQTWSWLSVIAIFWVSESRWHRLVVMSVLITLVFALLGASRRALFLPLLMSYLVIVLFSRSWKVKWVLAGVAPLVFWVAFGKNFLATIAYDGSFEALAQTYGSWASGLLRASSDIGITTVESLGTLQFLHLNMRLGFDHLISMVQIFPERTLGFDVEYPERIVRMSTEVFDGPEALDVPPGLIGQMWLDFRFAGPIIWGLVFGLQMSVVQFFFERTHRMRQATAVFVLVVFVVALPLNSGSFDFSFSVDIVALAVLLPLCVSLRRQLAVDARVARRGQTAEPPHSSL